MKSSYKGWNKKPHDDQLFKLVQSIKDRITKNDDDFLLMCVGETGTGKSSLMLHVMDAYNDKLSVDYVGLDPTDHTKALKAASEYKGHRFCGNDEANIQKRNSTTKYNKDLIDVYFAIRGFNIFNWWNNPSLDVIDKVFIQEKINAIIFIFSKEKNKPRGYFVYDKQALLQIYEKNKRVITLKVLRQSAHKHALYQGWFNKYEGRLWKPYLDKKLSRMDDKIDTFFNKYGKSPDEDVKLSASAVANTLGIDHTTVLRRAKKLIKEGLLLTPIHYTQNMLGRKFFTNEGAEFLVDVFTKEGRKLNLVLNEEAKL